MKKFFALDSPLMTALSALADLVLCNVLFCLCALPLFTAGAALTALYECTFSIVEGREDAVIVRQFWRAFRSDLKQGTALGVLCAAVFAFLGAYYLVVGALPGALQRTYRITFLVLAFLWLAVFQYLFPLQAKFHRKLAWTVKTAALLSAAALPWTLASLAVTGLAVYLSFFLNPDGLWIALFLWFTAVIAVVAYLNSFLMRQAVKRVGGEA